MLVQASWNKILISFNFDLFLHYWLNRLGILVRIFPRINFFAFVVEVFTKCKLFPSLHVWLKLLYLLVKGLSLQFIYMIWRWRKILIDKDLRWISYGIHLYFQYFLIYLCYFFPVNIHDFSELGSLYIVDLIKIVSYIIFHGLEVNLIFS